MTTPLMLSPDETQVLAVLSAHRGRELAGAIHRLAALKDERKEAMKEFAAREQAIVKDINRLAMDVRTGQGPLFSQDPVGRTGDRP